MPKDGKDKSKDKSASKPVASQDGDSDIEEEQIKVRWKKLVNGEKLHKNVLFFKWHNSLLMISSTLDL